MELISGIFLFIFFLLWLNPAPPRRSPPNVVLRKPLAEPRYVRKARK